ncbi:uncharacterized protein LOC62_02G002814 [Vanrija pseudolonga]|uniref:Uncharacterized protein n=1 Tax=Vanrija pseudolonga TaxID=143232 RepID=A0AAF0Y388_9TREE|nr:hypothetical protein LOC62_02G002814 [Vanrija pseudolonga]
MRLQQRSSSADINDRRNFRVHRLIERATGRPPPARRVNVSDISGPVEVLVPVGESLTTSQASQPGRSNSLSSSLTSRISRAFSISDRRTTTTIPNTHTRSHSTSASVIMGLTSDFAALSPPLTASTSSNWSYEDVATARHGYVPSSASTQSQHMHTYPQRPMATTPFGSYTKSSAKRPNTAPSSGSPSPPEKAPPLPVPKTRLSQSPLVGSSLFRETFSRLSAVANGTSSTDNVASSSSLRSRPISLPVRATLVQSGTPQPPSLTRRPPYVVQDSSLDTPSRPGFRSKREAICLSPLPVSPVSPLSTSFVHPPETPSSVNSSTSSRFRIPRKPVPVLTPEELGTPSPPPTPKMCTDTSAGETTSASSCSPLSSPAASAESMDTPQDEPTSPSLAPLSPNASFSNEMDRLFDELLDECRTPKVSRPPTAATQHVPMPEHRPVTPGRPLAHKTSSILRRTPAVRRSLRNINIHKRSQSHPLPDSPKISVPLTPSRETRHTRETSTPLPTCSPFKPFIPSQRSFEPLRAVRSRSSPMLATTSANIPAAGLQTPVGRVKDRVQQFERTENSPTAPSTPVKTLGAILNKNIRVNSDELTLESKRLMEEARARRAIR